MKGSLGHIIKNLAEDEFADDEILYCCCSAIPIALRYGNQFPQRLQAPCGRL
jgi:hypothetical protein